MLSICAAIAAGQWPSAEWKALTGFWILSAQPGAPEIGLGADKFEEFVGAR
jgi:hypothetical protein